MPFITYPLTLFALVGIPTLVAIYFLRNRFRKVPVSSLMLWRFRSRFLEGGSRITRLITPLTFFLELFVILLIIFAAIDPRWPADKIHMPLFIILDDSVSMLAGTGLDTPKEHAVKEIIRIARQKKRQPVHFILAGKEPQLIESFASGRDYPSYISHQWMCSSRVASLEDAINLAHEIAGEKSAILILTDHEPLPGLIDGEGIKWLAFGKTYPNAGIVNASRTTVNGKDRCFFEISGFSNGPVKTVLTIDNGKDRELLKRTLVLQQDTVERIILEVPHEIAIIHAWLSEDALKPDNHVYLVSEPERKVRTKLDIKNGILQELFLKGLNATDMYRPDATNPELVITDKPGSEPNTPAWVVRVYSEKEVKPYTGPFIMDMTHPLTKGIEMDGVIWGGGRMNLLPGIPVVTAGDILLITDEAIYSGQHEIHICLNPDYSNLQDTPNWPILMWNLLNWRMKESGGFTTVNVQSGDEINLLSSHESNLSNCVSGEWGRLTDREIAKQEYPSTSWIWIILAMAALTAHLGIQMQKRRGY